VALAVLHLLVALKLLELLELILLLALLPQQLEVVLAELALGVAAVLEEVVALQVVLVQRDKGSLVELTKVVVVVLAAQAVTLAVGFLLLVCLEPGESAHLRQYLGLLLSTLAAEVDLGTIVAQRVGLVV
jgi:hypothetical protein